jgi:hypothetical protein
LREFLRYEGKENEESLHLQLLLKMRNKFHRVMIRDVVIVPRNRFGGNFEG